MMNTGKKKVAKTPVAPPDGKMIVAAICKRCKGIQAIVKLADKTKIPPKYWEKMGIPLNAGCHCHLRLIKCRN